MNRTTERQSTTITTGVTKTSKLNLNHLMITFTYSIHSTKLFVSSGSVIDLGITFDHLLTFQSHIQRVTCKALKMLWVRQTIMFRI